MYKLYYSPGACSMAIHALLNELNQPVELMNMSITEGKTKSPEFLKINPSGMVPVLVDGDFVVREGAAIMLYLMEKHNSPMLPKSGKERSTAIQWLMFANATVHPAYSKMFFVNKTVTDAALKDQLLKAAATQVNKLWQEVDARLAKEKYICGSAVSGADILLTVYANWNGYFPGLINVGSNVKRLLKEISSRPACQKAFKEEKVEYKAAA
jgi:glutathione S-transferase